MKKTFLAIILVSFTFLVSATANLTVEVTDEADSQVDSQLILEQNGELIAENSSFLEAELQEGENYNLTQNIYSGPNVTIKELSLSEDLDLRPALYDDKPGKDSEFLVNTDKLYFIDQTFDFSTASITIDRPVPDRIARCNTLSSAECTEWQVDTTADYENSEDNDISSEGFTYKVEEFSGYTTGDISPAPELENIQIFDVEEQQEKREGGTLIDEGLNKTFEVVYESRGEFRFEFNVSNQGSDSWDLENDDLLVHRGLNQSWSVDEIYYIFEETYESGSFEDGNLQWDTQEGPTIETGESLSAEYIVNISQSSSNLDQDFEASTDSGVGDQEEHSLQITRLGSLVPEIDLPGNNTVLQKNSEFVMNGTVHCDGGECGEVETQPRRNTTEGKEGFNGEAFEVLEKHEICGALADGESCTVEWSVNATADVGTEHEIDFEASASEYNTIENRSSDKSFVEIQDVMSFSLNWDSVEFGFLDPGDTNRSALGNSEGHTVEVDEDSVDIDNLWIKSSPLNHDSDESYSISPGNMTYSDVNDTGDTDPIPEEFGGPNSLVATDLSAGDTKNLYYWINVPLGILSGEYSGTITFKANQTL